MGRGDDCRARRVVFSDVQLFDTNNLCKWDDISRNFVLAKGNVQFLRGYYNPPRFVTPATVLLSKFHVNRDMLIVCVFTTMDHPFESNPSSVSSFRTLSNGNTEVKSSTSSPDPLADARRRFNERKDAIMIQ